MRVLVTGCGGFLGSEIVRQLIDRGDQVVGIARGDYPQLRKLGMQQTRGDLTNADFVSSVVCDADAVIHTAAIAGVWGPYRRFYQTNTVATERIIAACRRSGISQLVFTSSPSVTFDGQDQENVDETAPYPTHWLCAYPQTKALAEQAVLEAHRCGELHTCALRPHLIWGEDDPHILPRIILRARQGRLRIIGSGENLVDTVHVVNAAAAHLDALDSLRSNPELAGGRAYFIAQDEPVDCWDWIATICRIADAPEPQKRITFSAAYRVGAILEGLYRLAGRQTEPPMTRFVAAQLARHHYFDISAAKQRLGYHVRIPLKQGLQRLEDRWLQTGPPA